MRKIIAIGNKITVIFDDGSIIDKEITKEEFKKLIEIQTDDKVRKLLCPEYKEAVDKRNKTMSFIDKVKASNILAIRDNTIYWEEVSSLSVPQDFAEVVIAAEEEKDELKISTYKNFWTLMSLNPSEECRKNLYWFLQLHGLKLAKCGFFVAYRNVDTTEEKDVYTDHHSHSTKIKIGEMVTIPREKCDCDSSNECSKGLNM